MTNSQAVYAVCLDIYSVSDSIWIGGLIYKLETLGLRGKLGRWIANYLSVLSIRVCGSLCTPILAVQRRHAPGKYPLLFSVHDFPARHLRDSGDWHLPPDLCRRHPPV